MNKMQKISRMGFLILSLILLASSALAALPADLTFSTNMATAQAGQEFVVRLEKSPVGTPIDPFGDYTDVTISLPGEISSLGEPLTIDLSTYTAGPIYTWHLNSTQIASGIYQINVSVNSSAYNDSASITISGVLENPDFTVSMPAIATQSVGNSFVVSVNIANGGGDATQINGYISAQKAGVNVTSFSVASIPKLGSNTFQLLVTPSQYGTAILYVGISSYRKSDGTIVSVGHPDFDLTSSSVTRTFTVNANPVVNLNTAISIGISGYDDSIYLDYYVTDADTALADLIWLCSSDDPRIVPTPNPINRRLNITTTEIGEYSGTITCIADDGVATDSGSFEVNVNSACIANWQWSDWSSCQPDGNQSRTYSDQNNCGGSPVVETRTCIYTPPSTPPSNGGGGSSQVIASKIFTWGSIDADTTVAMLIDMNQIRASEAEFKTSNDVDNVKIKVSALRYLDGSIDNPEGPVNQYLYFETTNIDDSDIDYLKIDFNIPKSWLTEKQLEESEIVLLRYNGEGWDELPTELTASTAINSYFQATSPGFGYFAIGKGTGAVQEMEELGKEPVEEKITPTEEESVSELGSGDVELEETSEEGEMTGAAVTEAEHKRVPSWLKFLIYALILVALISLVVFLVMLAIEKKGSRPKTEKKEKKGLFKRTSNFLMEEDEDFVPLRRPRKKNKAKK